MDFHLDLDDIEKFDSRMANHMDNHAAVSESGDAMCSTECRALAMLNTMNAVIAEKSSVDDQSGTTVAAVAPKSAKKRTGRDGFVEKVHGCDFPSLVGVGVGSIWQCKCGKQYELMSRVDRSGGEVRGIWSERR